MAGRRIGILRALGCAGIEGTAAVLHEQYRRAQWTFGEVFQACISGLTFFQTGNAARARGMYEHALEAAVLLHGELSLLASMPALPLRDDLGAARHHLCEAIRIAAPHRLMRSFIDASQEIRSLLQSVLGAHDIDEVARDYARELLAGFAPEKTLGRTGVSGTGGTGAHGRA